MTKRLLWFAIGAGVTLYAVAKVRAYLDQASPEALGNRAAASITAAREGVLDFTARFRAGMVESEAEIRESLGLPRQP
jgi:hypothetical protein